MFGLIDEYAKSIYPGNFERHWGLFNYDGTVKYKLDFGNNRTLVPAKGVRYLPREWCVMAPEASETDPSLADSINYACQYADCTSLGYGSSCNGLDAKSNASYAFNKYFQTSNQQKGSCNFHNLSVTTRIQPTTGKPNCKYEIQIDLGKHVKAKSPATSVAVSRWRLQDFGCALAAFLLSLIIGCVS